MEAKQQILNKLLNLHRTGCVWRWQPPGASLDHRSISYCDDYEMTGAWAFANLGNAFDPMDDYSDEGELVAIRPIRTEDGPEAYELILKGEILARFSREDVAWIWELAQKDELGGLLD